MQLGCIQPHSCILRFQVSAQPVLTQPPLLCLSLGASAKLTCTLSSEHSTYTIQRFQQHPGKAPQYVMTLKSDGSHSKGDGIPDRFSGSSSGANCYLTISNLQSEDEADYYCGDNYNCWPSPVYHTYTDEEEVRQKILLSIPSFPQGLRMSCPLTLPRMLRFYSMQIPSLCISSLTPLGRSKHGS